MKKLILILTLILLATLTSCTSKPQQGEPNTISSAETEDQTKESTGEAQTHASAFSDVYNSYRQAVKEKWDGNKLNKNDMSLMMLDCYGSSPEENIGYTYADLDENGKEEFIVALTDKFTDEYYGKLVLDVYTVDDNNQLVHVFSSSDRNRYYYAGKNLFANIGASDATTGFVTTVKLQEVEMVDMTRTTDPSNYVQIKLDLFK